MNCSFLCVQGISRPVLLLQYSLIYVDLGLQLNSVSVVADRSLFFMYFLSYCICKTCRSTFIRWNVGQYHVCVFRVLSHSCLIRKKRDGEYNESRSLQVICWCKGACLACMESFYERRNLTWTQNNPCSLTVPEMRLQSPHSFWWFSGPQLSPGPLCSLNYKLRVKKD